MNKSLGQIAYEAYFGYSGGISLITGSTLPVWEGQAAKIQAAWEAAAVAVTAAVLSTPSEELSKMLNSQ